MSIIAPIWPVLPTQYEVVLRGLGPGHASSYAFLCATLWIWPFACALGFVRAHLQEKRQVLPVSPKEIGQFILLVPFAAFFLVFDLTKAESRYLAFIQIVGVSSTSDSGSSLP
ncbi:hypothetical protein ACTGJ9_027590 [Bradyrhizobium sp. RDM12]